MSWYFCNFPKAAAEVISLADRFIQIVMYILIIVSILGWCYGHECMLFLVSLKVFFSGLTPPLSSLVATFFLRLTLMYATFVANRDKQSLDKQYLRKLVCRLVCSCTRIHFDELSHKSNIVQFVALSKSMSNILYCFIGFMPSFALWCIIVIFQTP